MVGMKKPSKSSGWSITDTYDFISTFLTRPSARRKSPSQLTTIARRSHHSNSSTSRKHVSHPIAPIQNRLAALSARYFHDYFVTHLPSSSLHPDSRSSAGPHHKLPRSESTPHNSNSRHSPAAPPPMVGPSRELTVVRIPLRSAKHHFGVSVSRGTRPYNEDTYQAGTIEIPAFARRAPISLSRSKNKDAGGTSAEGASGDPQVFYFGVFDGHGGSECSEFLRDRLHGYVEESAEEFELRSSLKKESGETKEYECEEVPQENLDVKGREALKNIDIKSKDEVAQTKPERVEEGQLKAQTATAPLKKAEAQPQGSNDEKARKLQLSLVRQWKDTVGGYFRRFQPAGFALPNSPETPPTTIESVLMYSFLRADLDFVSAQARKPDPTGTSISDAPLNNDDILGRSSPREKIGGPTRFKGGSTCSIALISTPTPTPFWHPSSPSTLLVAHVGDTRILLCSTSTGQAVPLTTNHHPSSPIESTRLRRYATSFVTDSFGEERMSGLANTRAFGDMASKRIGVSAEPELVRFELGPAQYSFLVLVSDGISGTLGDQEIVDVVKEARTPEQGARELVSYATEVSKEGDNATALVVRLGGWERRAEGGGGGLGTRELREYRRMEAADPRRRKT